MEEVPRGLRLRYPAACSRPAGRQAVPLQSVVRARRSSVRFVAPLNGHGYTVCDLGRRAVNLAPMWARRTQLMLALRRDQP